MQSSYHKQIIMITVGILIGVFVFFLGFSLGKNKSFADSPVTTQTIIGNTAIELGQFWNVWNLLNEKYPFKEKIPSDTDRVYGTISGMVASIGDPYTMFFPPKQAKLFAEDVKGEFSGVGMEVGNKDGVLTVISPLKGSPAERAGIQPGDIIAKINNITTEGMSTDEAINLIRGKAGTTVELSIFRKGDTDLRVITVTRDTIAMPIIDTKIDGDVFIINLYSFSETSSKLFADAFVSFKKSGLKKMIIDLRNNPGGYLDAAVDIGSYFVPQGKILVRENSGDQLSEIINRSHGTDESLPAGFQMMILVNGGSASASEILAGALSEHGVADLVGTRTFGKGSVQELVPLSDGSSVKITVAKWFTPNGISISDKGITPKYIVTEKSTDKNPDPVLHRAFELLKQKK
jgi:carboxyl-terminal processing protease